jgi:hypothetical protein
VNACQRSIATSTYWPSSYGMFNVTPAVGKSKSLITSTLARAMTSQ